MFTLLPTAMSDYIEGVGGEVLISLLVSLLALGALLTLAWRSTFVRPLWGPESMWIVQFTQTAANRNTVELTQIDERDAQRLTASNGARVVRVTASIDDSRTDVASAQHVSPAAQLQPATGADAQTLADVVMQSTNATVGDNENATISANATTGLPLTPLVEVPSTSANNGSAPPPPRDGGDANIRLKYVDDTHRCVKAWLDATVAEFKRAHFESDVSAGKCVRLIYGGQLLRDDSRSLASYGIRDESTVHCHVSRAHYNGGNNGVNLATNQQSTAAIGSDLWLNGPATNQRFGLPHAAPMMGVRFELGNYMHVIFAAKFAMLWCFFAIYPQYFDFSSFFSLIVCTGVYAAFVGINFRRPSTDVRVVQLPLETASAPPVTNQEVAPPTVTNHDVAPPTVTNQEEAAAPNVERNEDSQQNNRLTVAS